MLSQAGQELKGAAQNVGDRLYNAGEALSNAPRNFVDNVGNKLDGMGQQIAQTFDNAVQFGISKLKELQSQFSEKFRPLVDNAIQIFEKPGTEKQHWNELVERVESTNLSEAEKQELYQRIANATVPQQRSPHK
jgi:hypothetical protein